MTATTTYSAALTVREVMTAELATVGPDETVDRVVRTMCDRRIGAVLVVNEFALAGIFTERDLIRVAAAGDPWWRDRPVSASMSPKPYTIEPAAGWEAAMEHMDRLRVRHLPVVEDGRVAGIVSLRQLIARRADHLNRLVEARTAELQQLAGELLERDRLLQYELNVAGRLLGRALLPGSPPGGRDVCWAVRYAPLDALGGDYYDFVAPDDRQLGVLIADASGHSVPAAMVTVMARIAFAEVVRTTTRPCEVLAGMNERLLGLTEDRFVTAFFGQYDRATRQLFCANAGHPAPLHVSSATRECRPIGPRGLMLGVLPEMTYIESSVQLAAGDRLCFYTDGVVDAENAGGESFGVGRLQALLRDLAEFDAQAIVNQLTAELAAFCGDRPPGDDVTVLVAAFH